MNTRIRRSPSRSTETRGIELWLHRPSISPSYETVSAFAAICSSTESQDLKSNFRWWTARGPQNIQSGAGAAGRTHVFARLLIITYYYLPIERDRYQRKHRRRDRPVSYEVGCHAQFQTESPVGVEHVNEVG